MSILPVSFYVSVLVAVMSFHAMAESANGRGVIDVVSKKVSARDVQGLVDLMPSLEPLWNEDPLAYLNAVRQAVPVLRAASSSEARKAALDTFSNLLSKKGPSDTAEAAAYFQLKSDIIGDYFNLEEVRSDKARLLMIASFVGEVRSRLIPDYKNQGTTQPGLQILLNAQVREAADLPNAALKDAYAKAVKQNEEELKMNELQLALFSANQTLTFSITGYAEAFPSKRQETRDFLKELATRAKLTAEEWAKLRKR